ncbi:hypothetical protein VTK26DRAFT_4236 [Humicola hyalothermophila]
MPDKTAQGPGSGRSRDRDRHRDRYPNPLPGPRSKTRRAGPLGRRTDALSERAHDTWLDGHACQNTAVLGARSTATRCLTGGCTEIDGIPCCSGPSLACRREGHGMRAEAGGWWTRGANGRAGYPNAGPADPGWSRLGAAFVRGRCRSPRFGGMSALER